MPQTAIDAISTLRDKLVQQKIYRGRFFKYLVYGKHDYIGGGGGGGVASAFSAARVRPSSWEYQVLIHHAHFRGVVKFNSCAL